MANHKSAKKRAKQSEVRYARNKGRKTAVKTIIKKLEAAVSENQGEEARQHFLTAQKMIAQTAAKGVFPKKSASRKVSRLARLANSVN